MKTFIKPTIGRVVLFYPAGFSPEVEQPNAAIITHVHSDDLINVVRFDGNGEASGRTSVILIQPGDPAPTDGGFYAGWMTYQVEQQAKTDSAKVVFRDSAEVTAAVARFSTDMASAESNPAALGNVAAAPATETPVPAAPTSPAVIPMAEGFIPQPQP